MEGSVPAARIAERFVLKRTKTMYLEYFMYKQLSQLFLEKENWKIIISKFSILLIFSNPSKTQAKQARHMNTNLNGIPVFTMAN